METRLTLRALGFFALQMIDIIETVYRGASKGRGLVVAPKGKLTYSQLSIGDG